MRTFASNDKPRSDTASRQPLSRELQNLLRDKAIILPLALALAIVITLLKYDVSGRYMARVAITATGNAIANEAKGSVVWLNKPDLAELRQDRVSIARSTGWQIKDGILVSLRDQPAELILNGFFRDAQKLEFVTSPYSGHVLVRVNGNNRKINLREVNPGVRAIPLNHFWMIGERSDFSSATILLTPFAKIFLLSMFFVALVHFLYQRSPEPRTGNVKILMPPRDRRKHILIFSSVSLFAVFVAAFYPGVMMYDSYLMYYQTLSHQFDDWHSPMMAVPWAVINRFIDGSGGMFLLHIFLIIQSSYLLSKIALIKGKRSYFLPLLIPTLPVISIMIFVLMTDVTQALFMLCASVLWFYSDVSGTLTKSRFFLILLLLFYGCSVRHTAMIAALPLCFLFIRSATSWNRRTAFLASLLLAFVFLAANRLMVYQVLEARKSYVSQAVMSHDLMGIYDLTGKNYFPPEYMNKGKLDSLMPVFHHENLDYTTFVNTEDQFMTNSPEVFRRLQEQWLLGLFENPGAYLKHRWILYRTFLMALDEWTPTTVVSEKPPDIVGGMPPPLMYPTLLSRIHSVYVYWLYQHCGFLFQGITYLFLSLGILIVAVRNRESVSSSLAASSILYIVSFFAFAPRQCYRYIYWPVISALVSVCILYIQLPKRGPQPEDQLSIQG